ELPGLLIDQPVGAIAAETPLGHLAGIELFAHHRLDGVAPERDDRADSLVAHRGAHLIAATPQHEPAYDGLPDARADPAAEPLQDPGRPPAGPSLRGRLLRPGHVVPAQPDDHDRAQGARAQR